MMRQEKCRNEKGKKRAARETGERKRQKASGERNGRTKKAKNERREKRGNEKAKNERREKKWLSFIAAREGFEWGSAPF